MRSRNVSLVVVLALALGAPAVARAASLPTVASGPLPGPDILYEPPATAPQLTNAGEQWLVQDERAEIRPLDRERFEAILQDLLS